MTQHDHPIEDERSFVGVPDGFDRLWTPHRMAYVTGERPSDEAGDGCPFCVAPDKGDAEGLIVHRGETCYVDEPLPYNAGHVLVCPTGTSRSTSTSPTRRSPSSPPSPRR